MTDPFALLGIPRKLGLEASEIDRLVREASQQHHPDAGGDEELFKKIRLAGEVLKSPAKRIRAAIECEGLEFDGRGEIPEEVMDYFSPVATVLQNVDGFVSERSKAVSGLGKAVLDAKVPGLKSDLERVIGNLNELESRMIADFASFDERGWAKCGTEMSGIARGLVFVTKWTGQLREATGKLFEALLGG
ncbi:J domain-containing protein [Akkermansiaceae bacterium]|nr:J domain-containing protein [Akkermansiaceae bacterium]MDA7868207.1 J domain-containing protein [bacterium]MDA7891602.1 J domain-containing protein [Akkermansiaceae bacterium]MDA7933515.1 J domain-containing protein [Akkermansiaceae bacterium]MDA9831031.1 J domain-containing protein [Akkermansiaceae bacterium]